MAATAALERAYPHLPLLMQNVLISGQGLLFRRQRYRALFWNAFAEGKFRAGQSAEWLEHWQLEALRSFLDHAQQTSPYWQRAFRETGFDPRVVSTLNDLRSAPILEKADLRSRTAEIASVAVPKRRQLPVFTSGTTGTPISLGIALGDMRERMATLARMFDLFGVQPLARSVRFSGRTLFPNARSNRVFWRHNYAMNQLLMSSYDLHPDNMQAYVDCLVRYRPEVIDGYPSSIYVLAKFINATGYEGRIRPKVVMTTAETLEGYQQVEIMRAFADCPVLNQYASSEGAPFITTDTDGELVVNTDTGVFEFVRPGTAEPARPGEIAEMLVTSFTTHAYPLIRYRIGDTVLLPETPRRSRVWDMPVVEGITGRREDILYTPERGYVGRLDPVFKKSPPTVIECQIVQTAPMAITLRVVPDRGAGYDPGQLEQIKAELRQRLGAVSIAVEELESLPRGANGKLRAVVGLPS